MRGRDEVLTRRVLVREVETEEEAQRCVQLDSRSQGLGRDVNRFVDSLYEVTSGSITATATVILRATHPMHRWPLANWPFRLPK